jgi:hypothetical protein
VLGVSLLRVFEKRLLRRIFEPTRYEITREQQGFDGLGMQLHRGGKNIREETNLLGKVPFGRQGADGRWIWRLRGGWNCLRFVSSAGFCHTLSGVEPSRTTALVKKRKSAYDVNMLSVYASLFNI